MSIEANNELGRSFFAAQDRLLGGPDPELCTPAYTAHLAGFPPFDLTGHNQFASAFYTGFPDIYHIVEETIATPDNVTVRCVLRGTHTGNFLGIPATGKPIEVPAIMVLKVEDGKVSTLWGQFDQFGLMKQLGAA
jgi:predicted ester cyclase